MVDFNILRQGIGELDASASHSASGENRPRVKEIFAPAQHAGALDPNTSMVLGSRGAGKSFWAGVLGNDSTRLAASEAYPNIGLENLIVRFGFTGISGDNSVSRATIDARVPVGQERIEGVLLWRCVILRALKSALPYEGKLPTIRSMMDIYSDPEDWESECSLVDIQLASTDSRVLVIFDALDSLAENWDRLRDITDALLEVVWSIRGYKTVRAKLFLRPDQIRDLGLRFVELPKMVSGATNLKWSGINLYGMFYSRIGLSDDAALRQEFNSLLNDEGTVNPPESLKRLRRWPLAVDRNLQAQLFKRMAGSYMGRGSKKGRTYDWPTNHLADGHGEVTPRSFLTLMIAAANFPVTVPGQALTAEGIRHGLREASKVRVNQLELEFPWIKRVLAPLARIQVPCTLDVLTSRWEETSTVHAVMRRALSGEFLPPFEPTSDGEEEEKLSSRLVRIGVLTVRNDGRFDMPDLFRVAARLLKKGGVAPG